MRIPGFKTAKKTVMWLKNRIYPGAIILGYHRVASVEIDSFSSCISPENFDQQMEVLSRYANPVSLEDLTERIGHSDPLPKTVCITIDDGYADTLYNALPILEKYNLPATVFVTVGNLGGEFWWDELERTILNVSGRVDNFRMSVGNSIYEWDFSTSDISKRMQQVISIANVLRPLSEQHRRQLLDELRRWAGNPQPTGKSQARSLTPDELITLIDNGMVDIGSHSLTHPRLPLLNVDERWNELNESKRKLEIISSKPVHGFSYPHGSFMESDPELVRRAGYLYACESKNGTVRKAGNLFMLPRFWPQDIDGRQFQRWLFKWI